MPTSDMPVALRVLIVDDHAVVRAGLRAVLEGEEGVEVCGEASSASEAVHSAEALRPSVILMDIRMGEGEDASGTFRSSPSTLRWTGRPETVLNSRN